MKSGLREIQRDCGGQPQATLRAAVRCWSAASASPEISVDGSPQRGKIRTCINLNGLRRAKSRLEIVRRPIFSWPRTGSDGHSDASGAHDGTGGQVAPRPP